MLVSDTFYGSLGTYTYLHWVLSIRITISYCMSIIEINKQTNKQTYTYV